MKRLVRATCIAACAVGALLALAVGGYCAQLFCDSFEGPSQWSDGPASWSQSSGRHMLEGQNNHIRTPGLNGVRSWDNWRYPYNDLRALGASYDGNVYLKCWIFEDNDIPVPQAGTEVWPNGYISLANSAWISNPLTGDACSIGVMGEIGRVNLNDLDFYYNCCVYTPTDYYQVLNGDAEYGVPLVPRRQGWRKYTILVNGYTGNPGDVQFLIDDKLVYNGLKKEGSTYDSIVLGAKWWTHETYFYDQVEFGSIETPVNCGTIAQAEALPNETWVSLESKIVAGCFSYSDLPNSPPSYDKPSPGYLAIEEYNRSSALWVSSSYQASVLPATNQSQRINVRGILRTNEAGMRYLDAIEISPFDDPITHYDPVNQPGALGTTLRNLGSPLLDGKLVKVWGKVINIPGLSPATVHGQERPGDWRRYFMIDDGSGGGPIKCYYANIIQAKPGIDPVPAVQNGDHVTVVGVVGREVLVPGTTGAEKSIWIRGAGDLKIVP